MRSLKHLRTALERASALAGGGGAIGAAGCALGARSLPANGGSLLWQASARLLVPLCMSHA